MREKLEKIKLFYEELEGVFRVPAQEIQKDYIKCHAVERLLQLIVDEILDVNNHLIARLNLELPDDFQGTFQILSDNKIIPEELAKKIAPVVGLRNRLVHRYEKIDLDFILRQIQNEKANFKNYIKFIEEYIDSYAK